MGLWQMSVSGAVLILVVAGIRTIWIERLPRRAFLILWEIVLLRLLIPFSIPSVWSVYTLVEQHTVVGNWNDVLAEPKNVVMEGEGIKGTELRIPEKENTALPWGIIWIVGVVVSSVYFMVRYVRCYREFSMSLPVQNEFAKKWLEEQRIWRKIVIRQSDRILTPLTYGILHPVILMPKRIDYKDTEKIRYILMHEYIHICRMDMVRKLLLVGTLCVHWFNPVVWLMYRLCNRDIELVCDECVIHRLGEEKRASYARMLIELEAKKSGLLPFGSYFNRDAVEERIVSIMKIKRVSLLAVCMAVLMIGAVTVTFVTSASNDKGILSKEDYNRLYALQFDNYEKMSVAEYQKRVWEITDTKEYRELFERLDTEEALYEQRGDDKLLSFAYYVLEPLTAEKWQSREIGGYALTPYLYNAMLEFFLTFTIQDAGQVTVGEYNKARIEVIDGLQEFLNEKTREELQDAAFMESMIKEEIERLASLWGSAALQIEVEFLYRPLLTEEEESKVDEEVEKRRYAHATEEDYRSLFQLMTADYQKQSVADFNALLLQWADEDHERMERISCDVGYDDFLVDLTADERYFVMVSTELSGMENSRYIQSYFSGSEEEDPYCQRLLEEKYIEVDGGGAWCDLYYQFSYHIANKEKLTIGERDNCVYGMISDVQKFWDKTTLEEMLKMTEEDIFDKLKEFAENNSNSEISIIINEDDIGFESMDERNIR